MLRVLEHKLNFSIVIPLGSGNPNKILEILEDDMRRLRARHYPTFISKATSSITPVVSGLIALLQPVGMIESTAAMATAP